MEQHLFRRIHSDSIPRRLALIMAELLHQQEMIHHLKPDPDHLAQMSERVQEVRQQLLAQMEDHYAGSAVNDQSQTRDRTWRLSSYLRDLLRQGRQFSAESRERFRIDLAGLKRVAQMGSWQPQYVDLDPSQERLAEMVLKLEREVYGIKRPRQLANRDVFLRIGEPIDLGRFVASYLQDAQAVRHEVAEGSAMRSRLSLTRSSPHRPKPDRERLTIGWRTLRIPPPEPPLRVRGKMRRSRPFPFHPLTKGGFGGVYSHWPGACATHIDKRLRSATLVIRSWGQPASHWIRREYENKFDEFPCITKYALQ